MFTEDNMAALQPPQQAVRAAEEREDKEMGSPKGCTMCWRIDKSALMHSSVLHPRWTGRLFLVMWVSRVIATYKSRARGLAVVSS